MAEQTPNAISIAKRDYINEFNTRQDEVYDHPNDRQLLTGMLKWIITNYEKGIIDKKDASDHISGFLSHKLVYEQDFSADIIVDAASLEAVHNPEDYDAIWSGVVERIKALK